MQFTDTSEKGFQKFIVNELTTKGGYVESVSNDFDKEFCNNTKQLFSFIEQTQPIIFKKFTQDKDFQRRYKEFVFDTLVESSNRACINP